ncbi:hypothetical protein B0H15DRAFT_965755 [Mycena belliarum]|uniref:tRNA-dihydrouridine(47) synthase [NAD(P)(+)] n=1 Tax=Mycena belliarum TaxID=1033014 RepID=A0AAD6XGP2_9AGAR|nr:hypothetical protein B0H15DRAFT_965755 [Mycena belliae]
MDDPAPGTAHIPAPALVLDDDDTAEGATGCTRGVRGRKEAGGGLDVYGGVPHARTKRTKAQKHAQSGANKGRRFGKVVDGVDCCYHVAAGEGFELGERWRNNHDVRAYLAAKPPDILFPRTADVQCLPLPDAMQVDADCLVSRPPMCPVFEETGECSEPALDFELVQDTNKLTRSALTNAETNRVSGHTLKLLRTTKYPFPITTTYQKELPAVEVGTTNVKSTPGAGALVFTEPDQEDDEGAIPAATTPVALPAANEEPVIPARPTAAAEATAAKPDADEIIAQRTAGAAPPDAVDGRVRFREKNRLDWAGKTYLATLTTVGNLPFRRLCVPYGADITCGETGLATSVVSDSKEESRGPSYDATPRSALSALLDNANRLVKIVRGMSRALGAVPVTVKLCTGVKDGRNTAHKLMPWLGPEFGADSSVASVRMRQQRYTKLADWAHIKGCVDAVRAREADEDHLFPAASIRATGQYSQSWLPQFSHEASMPGYGNSGQPAWDDFGASFDDSRSIPTRPPSTDSDPGDFFDGYNIDALMDEIRSAPASSIYSEDAGSSRPPSVSVEIQSWDGTDWRKQSPQTVFISAPEHDLAGEAPDMDSRLGWAWKPSGLKWLDDDVTSEVVEFPAGINLTDKQKDSHSYGGSTGSRNGVDAKLPGSFFGLSGEEKISCRRATPSCSGVVACESLDPVFLNEERRELDPEPAARLVAATLRTREMQDDTDPNRFYHSLQRWHCNGVRADGEHCDGSISVRKLRMPDRGKNHILLCSKREDALMASSFHSQAQILDHVPEDLLLRAMSGEPIHDAPDTEDKCPRVVSGRTGGKGKAQCPFNHHKGGLPYIAKVRTSLHPELARMAVVVPSPASGHTHPPPPANKCTPAVAERYRECVRRIGLGATVAKVENAETTKALLDGKTPGLFHPGLISRDTKTRLVQQVKAELNGVPGDATGKTTRQQVASYLSEQETLSDEKRFLHSSISRDGKRIIFGAHHKLLCFIHHLRTLDCDTTFKPVAGEMQIFEINGWLAGIKESITVLRVWMEVHDRAAYKAVWEEILRLVLKLTRKQLKFKGLHKGGKVLGLNSDMEAAPLLGLADAFAPTVDIESVRTAIAGRLVGLAWPNGLPRKSEFEFGWGGLVRLGLGWAWACAQSQPEFTLARYIYLSLSSPHALRNIRPGIPVVGIDGEIAHKFTYRDLWAVVRAVIVSVAAGNSRVGAHVRYHWSDGQAAQPAEWLAKPTDWLASQLAGLGLGLPPKSKPKPKQANWRGRKPFGQAKKGVPELLHLSPAHRKRISDVRYLKTPEEVEVFKVWIPTLPDPQGVIKRWWDHKLMHRWLLPGFIHCLSKIPLEQWNTMEATTNLGEAQHAWNNSQTGISMGVIESFRKYEELDIRRAQEIEGRMSTGLSRNSGNEVTDRFADRTARRTRALDKGKRAHVADATVVSVQAELSETKEELKAARADAKAERSDEAAGRVRELETAVNALAEKLKLAKAEAKSNSSGRARPKRGAAAPIATVASDQANSPQTAPDTPTVHATPTTIQAPIPQPASGAVVGASTLRRTSRKRPNPHSAIDASSLPGPSSGKRQKMLTDPLANWEMEDPDTMERLTGHEWVRRFPDEFEKCYKKTHRDYVNYLAQSATL